VVEVGWKVVEHDGWQETVWEVADYAAGWHKGSAYPGQVGNTVITGHHNIRGEVFRNLWELEPGDEVLLYVGETEYRFVVVKKMILPDKYVSPEQKMENARWIGYFPDVRVTLVTCWPYENNTHRVIVIAKPPQVLESNEPWR